MDYISFGKSQKISKRDVQAFMDIYKSLKSGIEKNTIESLQWEDHLVRICDRFTIIPHEHYSSNLGPFCGACFCLLPGPNGEWE